MFSIALGNVKRYQSCQYVCVCVLSLGKGGLVGRVCMSECVCVLCAESECIVREMGEMKNLPCREREGAGEEREREKGVFCDVSWSRLLAWR